MCETKVEYLWEVEAKNSKIDTPVVSGVSTVKEFEEPFNLPIVYVPSMQYPYCMWKIVYTAHPTCYHLNR